MLTVAQAADVIVADQAGADHTMSEAGRPAAAKNLRDCIPGSTAYWQCNARQLRLERN